MKRLALACALVAGCDESPAIPVSALDTDQTRSASSLPTGYPEGFPLVANGRVVEGAVDPGVIRTAVLEYAGGCDAFEPELLRAFEAAGVRVIDRAALAEGSASIRASAGTREASFSMTNDLHTCMLRTIASDRP